MPVAKQPPGLHAVVKPASSPVPNKLPGHVTLFPFLTSPPPRYHGLKRTLPSNSAFEVLHLTLRAGDDVFPAHRTDALHGGWVHTFPANTQSTQRPCKAFFRKLFMEITWKRCQDRFGRCYRKAHLLRTPWKPGLIAASPATAMVRNGASVPTATAAS